MPGFHSVSASAPGKTNLFFAVGPLQEDGFHEVASIYLALNLREQVSVTPAAEWSVSVSGNVSVEQLASVPTGAENLVVKAAHRVAELAGIDAQPIAFEIDKHVPVAGGMGGGSADAAAALLAVNSLWCAGVESQLTDSVNLGADVPFAVSGGIAIGLGRGEKLTAIEAVPELNLVLVTSGEGLSTPAVYKRLDELRSAAGNDPNHAAKAEVPSALIDALKAGDLGVIATLLSNDLQAAALDLRPDLAKTIEDGISAGALTGFVSGSGPTVAFLVSDANSAEELAQKLHAEGHNAIAAAGPAVGTFILEVD
ncbi:MAG: 4-(cytidine 5'-diphospho)-2-C-methyl-D-erythritol kinase [Rhodoluna sp.]